MEKTTSALIPQLMRDCFESSGWKPFLAGKLLGQSKKLQSGVPSLAQQTGVRGQEDMASYHTLYSPKQYP